MMWRAISLSTILAETPSLEYLVRVAIKGLRPI